MNLWWNQIFRHHICGCIYIPVFYIVFNILLFFVYIKSVQGNLSLYYGIYKYFTAIIQYIQLFFHFLLRFTHILIFLYASKTAKLTWFNFKIFVSLVIEYNSRIHKRILYYTLAVINIYYNVHISLIKIVCFSAYERIYFRLGIYSLLVKELYLQQFL